CDLAVARVPGQPDADVVRVRPGGRDAPELLLDERRPTVERCEVDCVVRQAGAAEEAERRAADAVLQIDCGAILRSPVAIEVPPASPLDRRVVRRGVPDAIVGRGELLFVADIRGGTRGLVRGRVCIY